MKSSLTFGQYTLAEKARYFKQERSKKHVDKLRGLFNFPDAAMRGQRKIVNAFSR